MLPELSLCFERMWSCRLDTFKKVSYRSYRILQTHYCKWRVTLPGLAKQLALRRLEQGQQEDGTGRAATVIPQLGPDQLPQVVDLWQGQVLQGRRGQGAGQGGAPQGEGGKHREAALVLLLHAQPGHQVGEQEVLGAGPGGAAGGEAGVDDVKDGLGDDGHPAHGAVPGQPLQHHGAALAVTVTVS